MFLLAASTVGNHAAARAIHRAAGERARKALLGARRRVQPRRCSATSSTRASSSRSAENALSRLGLPSSSWALSVTLPIGISFFTFMAMSYVIDVYRRELEPVDFAALRRLPLVLPASRRRPDRPRQRAAAAARAPAQPAAASTRHARLLPDPQRALLQGRDREPAVDASRRPVFAAPDRHSSLEVLVAVYGYAVQIFADFMGYTNIAIGVALLLGFEFPQNFNSPYQRRLAPGLLAPLAHDPVALAARLPLHLARRQPQGPRADVRQPAR